MENLNNKIIVIVDMKRGEYVKLNIIKNIIKEETQNLIIHINEKHKCI